MGISTPTGGNLTSSMDLSLFPPSGTTADRVEVEHYDPYTNTWALTRPALKYVTNFTATACHGKLYVIGSCAVKYNALTMQCYNPVIGEERHPWGQSKSSSRRIYSLDILYTYCIF